MLYVCGVHVMYMSVTYVGCFYAFYVVYICCVPVAYLLCTHHVLSAVDLLCALCVSWVCGLCMYDPEE